MPASEREAQSPRPSRAADPRPPAGLSMRDLLASCAAASAVSTPPRELPRTAEPRETAHHRDAA